MVSVETLASVLDDFGGALPSVEVGHCLNARHKGAGCRLCADACPTQAIELQLGRPRLTPGRCVSCGLCLHACPTDVFSQRGEPEANLVQTVSSSPGTALSLVCPQHDQPATTRAPVSAVVQHSRCLVSLSVARLLELSEGGRRALWLDDSPCADCPIGGAQPAIAHAARATNQLLDAFGGPPAIRTLTGDADELDERPASRSVIDGDQPMVSRRSFFGALGQLTRRAAAAAIAEALPPPEAHGLTPVDQRLPHRIPASRERLYGRLKRLGTPTEAPVETAGLPFADVQVNAEACSACKLCARFCPTGALSFVADAESFVLYFRSAICIDCGLCAVACPEGAVSFGSRLAAAALVDLEPRPLVAGSLAACTGCGEPTAVPREQAGAPCCHVCRHATDPMAPLRDTAGLISELVRRLPGGAAPSDGQREE